MAEVLHLVEELMPRAGAQFGIVAERVATFQSKHQLIRFYHHSVFGNILRLDEHFQTSERDEHYYHEAMVHPAMFNDQPRSVLIVGGGDGGIAKQVLKHKCVHQVTIVELDPAVVDMCKKYIPSVSRGVWDDPRVQLIIGDGLLHAARSPGAYDLIILDLPDPEGPVAQLTGELGLCTFYNALTPSGSLVMHTGSILYQKDQVLATIERAKSRFQFVCDYSQYVPLYGSQWGMAFCKKTGGALLDEDNIKSRISKNPHMDFKLFNLGYFSALAATNPMDFWRPLD